VVALLTQLFHAQRDAIAGAQEARRLLAHADTGGRAGCDHVTRLQAPEMADIGDQLGDLEDHEFGRAELHALAIHSINRRF